MKHILEYNKFNDYKVISYEDNFENPNATDFDVEIESANDRRTIPVNYEFFLEFIQEIDPNLKSYLVNREELTDFESIFGNLEELGFDYKEYLQKWVDEHIDEHTLDEFDSEEYDEDDIDNAPKWWDDEDEDSEDDEWWKK
jgi:hypothetical protein